MMKLLTLFLMALLVAALVGCGGPQPDVVYGPVPSHNTPTPTPTRTIEAPATIPTPTASPAPSTTSVPTATPAPSTTPVSTATPAPEPSPMPSPVPTDEPTPVPTPSVVVDPTLVPDSFVAVAPKILRSGYTEQVSVSLFAGDAPASGNVRLTLFQGDIEVSTASAHIVGVGAVDLVVPAMAAGIYELELAVEDVAESKRAPVRVEAGVLLLVETDKPIYKPGQTVRIRVMTLDTGLKPLPSDATVEVQDAKGIKVFKTQGTTDDYGMTSVDLPLSTEPNLGVWKLTALVGDQKTQLDVRVEEYVLPKYEVSVVTERQWALANEPIKGTVKGEYSFGKPVVGEVEIVASRYIGLWEEYARFTAPIDGEAAFELPAVGFVAGVPQAGGQGNVTLDVTIREKSTGYEETTTELFTVAAAPVLLKVVPDSNVFKPGLEMGYLVVAQTPDGQPVDKLVGASFTYLDENFDTIVTRAVDFPTTNGKALLRDKAPSEAISLTLEVAGAPPSSWGQAIHLRAISSIWSRSPRAILWSVRRSTSV